MHNIVPANVQTENKIIESIENVTCTKLNIFVCTSMYVFVEQQVKAGIKFDRTEHIIPFTLEILSNNEISYIKVPTRCNSPIIIAHQICNIRIEFGTYDQLSLETSKKSCKLGRAEL